MEPSTEALIAIGGLLLCALVADFVGNRTRLPRVTLLLVVGIGAGPSVLDVLPETSEQWFPVATNLALVMIGFVVGGQFKSRRRTLRVPGFAVIALTEAVTTAFAVTLCVWVVGAGIDIALLLGGIAAATDSAASLAVVTENEAKGAVSNTLMKVVALDDVFALVMFSVLATLAGILVGTSGVSSLALHGVRETGGAMLLGMTLGVPASYLSGRIRKGEATLLEALGLTFLCAGLAEWLEVSPLLAAVTMGATVANLARHHTRPFNEIRGIEWPFLAVFFILAGASLQFGSLAAAGLLGIAYLLPRAVGKVGGAYLGARLTGAKREVRLWLGATLIPQAGVAIGLALLAAERFPKHETELLAVVVGATVIFELAGPVLARVALSRAGEIPPEQTSYTQT